MRKNEEMRKSLNWGCTKYLLPFFLFGVVVDVSEFAREGVV